MAVEDISDDRIVEKTGKSWAQWLKIINSFGGKDLTHKEIAQHLSELGVSGWYSQMLSVKYEQSIGRRVKGQDSDGTFTKGVGKVVNGELDEVYAKWLETVASLNTYNGQDVLDTRKSESDKWRYWRANMADGTRTVVGIHQQKPGKVGFAIDQQKCVTKESADQWQDFWREFIDKTFSKN